jgi:hypothetical protein
VSKLSLSRYQRQALEADNSPDKWLTFPMLGLFGEAGSLLSVAKKKQRRVGIHRVNPGH